MRATSSKNKTEFSLKNITKSRLGLGILAARTIETFFLSSRKNIELISSHWFSHSTFIYIYRNNRTKGWVAFQFIERNNPRNNRNSKLYVTCLWSRAGKFQTQQCAQTHQSDEYVWVCAARFFFRRQYCRFRCLRQCVMCLTMCAGAPVLFTINASETAGPIADVWSNCQVEHW